MMGPDRIVVRVLGIALLALALSPVTAPFATCDLLDLFDGATAPSAASIQSKASPHEPASEVGRLSVFHLVQASTPRLPFARPWLVDGSAPLDVPLRV